MEKNLQISRSIENDVILEEKLTAIGNDTSGVSRSENFFSKKKKKWMFLWGIAFALIIFISFKFISNINIVEFFKDLDKSSSISYFLVTVIIGFLTFGFCEIFIRVKVLKLKLKDKLKRVTKFDWISFSVVSFVIQSITPFSLGSEPYSVWWLNKKGVSLKDAGAAVAVTSFCWFIGQFLITWPSFIFITAQNWNAIHELTIAKTYWAILIGLFVDMAVAVFIFMISYSRKAHYYFSYASNMVKKNFGFQYMTHDEIVQKYLKNNVFQKLYVKELFQKSTIHVIFWFILNNIWVYSLFVIIYRIFFHGIDANYVNGVSKWDWMNFLNSYNIINVSTTANNFLPLPSAEGSLQVVIRNLMEGLESLQETETPPSQETIKAITKLNENTIFMWRFFNKYFGMILGVIFISIYGINVDSTSFFKKIKKSRQSLRNAHELVF